MRMHDEAEREERDDMSHEDMQGCETEIMPVPEQLNDKSVADILKEREKTHGDYNHVSCIFIDILRAIGVEFFGDLEDAPNHVKTTLIMDAMKTARIVCGNFCEVDHYMDKAGYATLSANLLKSPNPIPKR